MTLLSENRKLPPDSGREFFFGQGHHRDTIEDILLMFDARSGSPDFFSNFTKKNLTFLDFSYFLGRNSPEVVS